MIIYILDDKIEQVEQNAGSDKEYEEYLKSLNEMRKLIEDYLVINGELVKKGNK